MKNKIIFAIMMTALLGGFYWYITETLKVNTATTEVVVVQPVIEQNPVLLERLKFIGADYTDKINLIYLADLNDIPGINEPVRDTVIGMFTMKGDTNTIYVKTGVDPNQETKTIAHEYLHYVWNNYISQNEKEEIISLSRSLISNDWYLSGYMEYRVSQGDYSDREIFPVVCTERPDQYISTMVNICDKYIDRSKLTFLYN